MGLKEIFASFFSKKKEKDYDPLDIKVTNLNKGFLFDFDLKTWEVKEAYQYDWGNNHFSYEYKVDSGDDSAFLSLEDDDDISLAMMKKVNIRGVDEDLPEDIVKNQEPPKKLHYKGKKYYRGNETPGYFRDMADNSENAWKEFIAWDYTDESGQLLISIEQWGEKEFEAAEGKIIKEFEISNIVPAE